MHARLTYCGPTPSGKHCTRIFKQELTNWIAAKELMRKKSTLKRVAVSKPSKNSSRNGESQVERLSCDVQRKVFTAPLLSEANKRRNLEQFTKKKSRCQRGGVRGDSNQHAPTKRTNSQTKQCSKAEAGVA